LPRTEQLLFHCYVPDRDSRRILGPDYRQSVPAAQDYKFVPFEETLAVQLAVCDGIWGISRITGRESLACSRYPYQQSVRFRDPAYTSGPHYGLDSAHSLWSASRARRHSWLEDR
jgi:hypothetical protein